MFRKGGGGNGNVWIENYYDLHMPTVFCIQKHSSRKLSVVQASFSSMRPINQVAKQLEDIRKRAFGWSGYVGISNL